MAKEWLIRTANNLLVGPVTREKVIQLLEAGKLRDRDELCRGNGYWFYLSEKELVSKYLVKDQKQSFNPISEADTRLIYEDESASPEPLDVQKIPTDNDLEYPDLDFVTQKFNDFPVESVQLSHSDNSSNFDQPAFSKNEPVEVRDEDGVVKLPGEQDLEYPDLVGGFSAEGTFSELDKLDIGIPTMEAQEDLAVLEREESPESQILDMQEKEACQSEKPVSKVRSTRANRVRNHDLRAKVAMNPTKTKKKSDSLLLSILVLIVVIAAIGFYYFKNVLGKSLEIVSFSPISTVQAQVLEPLGSTKKKN